mmetsp:Transcript_22107/g.66040  ORF Transcript_22107/g.66040 Transcript_22107/m.66040 type:complete len:345 (-) Transcript_22107:625-1659(-)
MDRPSLLVLGHGVLQAALRALSRPHLLQQVGGLRTLGHAGLLAYGPRALVIVQSLPPLPLLVVGDPELAQKARHLRAVRRPQALVDAPTLLVHLNRVVETALPTADDADVPQGPSHARRACLAVCVQNRQRLLEPRQGRVEVPLLPEHHADPPDGLDGDLCAREASLGERPQAVLEARQRPRDVAALLEDPAEVEQQLRVVLPVLGAVLLGGALGLQSDLAHLLPLLNELLRVVKVPQVDVETHQGDAELHLLGMHFPLVGQRQHWLQVLGGRVEKPHLQALDKCRVQPGIAAPGSPDQLQDVVSVLGHARVRVLDPDAAQRPPNLVQASVSEGVPEVFGLRIR